MKQISFFIPLLGTLLLYGCAGTSTEFECNATTSDTCMTMEQANEKAKAREESASAKPAAAGLPRLADGNFRTSSPNSYPLPPQPVINSGRNTAPTVTVSNKSGFLDTVPVNHDDVLRTRTVPVNIRPVSVSTYTSPSTVPGNYPRPLRKGEQTASLWVAPYVDSDDVYHQPTTVVFVVTPSAWGQPRIN